MHIHVHSLQCMLTLLYCMIILFSLLHHLVVPLCNWHATMHAIANISTCSFEFRVWCNESFIFSIIKYYCCSTCCLCVVLAINEHSCNRHSCDKVLHYMTKVLHYMMKVLHYMTKVLHYMMQGLHYMTTEWTEP